MAFVFCTCGAEGGRRRCSSVPLKAIKNKGPHLWHSEFRFLRTTKIGHTSGIQSQMIRDGEVTFEKELSYNYSYLPMRSLGLLQLQLPLIKFCSRSN